MAFTAIDNHGARSEQGFEVVRTNGNWDAAEYEYRENGCTMTVAVTCGINGSDPCVSFETDAFKRWDGRYGFGQDLSQEEQHRIRANFTAAMEFLGLVVI